MKSIIGIALAVTMMMSVVSIASMMQPADAWVVSPNNSEYRPELRGNVPRTNINTFTETGAGLKFSEYAGGLGMDMRLLIGAGNCRDFSAADNPGMDFEGHDGGTICVDGDGNVSWNYWNRGEDGGYEYIGPTHHEPRDFTPMYPDALEGGFYSADEISPLGQGDFGNYNTGDYDPQEVTAATEVTPIEGVGISS